MVQTAADFTIEPVAGGVTAPAGFTSAALHCGIKVKSGALDLAILAADTPVSAAALFTVNLAQAAPVTLSKQHLERTQHFFRRYGGKTIVIARFIPIVRTYAPFVAGAGGMEYSRFVLFNVGGGFLWITIFLLGGFFFGNIPVVQENFGLVVIGIIVVSVLPPLIEYINHRRRVTRLTIDQ